MDQLLPEMGNRRPPLGNLSSSRCAIRPLHARPDCFSQLTRVWTLVPRRPRPVRSGMKCPRSVFPRILLALCAWAAMVPACSRNPEQSEVILYSSVDDYLLAEVVAAFEKESGIPVRVVGDTEATKTTGLVERLLAEKDRPRADVWWSSEPFGTIRLEREGILRPYQSPSTEIAGGWPADLKGDTWHGFATRARAIVYSTVRVPAERVPTSIAEFAAPAFKDRIGMARPQFGTTRGHLAYLLHACGEAEFRSLLQRLQENGVRLYDGNASVVRAVIQGEIDVGLTDTDDVWSAWRNDSPVGIAFEEATPGCAAGAMRIPNTVAMVKGAPHPEAAAQFIDFLLSEKAERIIVASGSHNMPVRPGAERGYEKFAFPPTSMPRYDAIADGVPRALAIWDDVMGG